MRYTLLFSLLFSLNAFSSTDCSYKNPSGSLEKIKLSFFDDLIKMTVPGTEPDRYFGMSNAKDGEYTEFAKKTPKSHRAPLQLSVENSSKLIVRHNLGGNSFHWQLNKNLIKLTCTEAKK